MNILQFIFGIILIGTILIIAGVCYGDANNRSALIGVVPPDPSQIWGRGEPRVEVHRLVDKEYKNVCYIAISTSDDDEEPVISCVSYAGRVGR